MGDVRPWTYAALFGALWGALELTLGTAFSLMRFPLGSTVMTVLGLVCLVTLRRLQPLAGVCLVAGAVAVLIKLYSLGGFLPGPIIGVAREALLVEAAFTLARSRRWGAVAGGAVAMAANPVQLVAHVWAVAGREAVVAYAGAAQALLGWIGLARVAPELILAAALVASTVLGGVAGAWAWVVAGRVRRRLGLSA